MDVSDESTGEASAVPSLLDTMTGSAEANALLQDIQAWLRILGGLGCIAGGLLSPALFVGVLMGMGAAADRSEIESWLVIGLAALLTLVPSVYLLRQGNRTWGFLRTGDQEEFVALLVAQRGFWQYVAILPFAAVALALAIVALGVSR